MKIPSPIIPLIAILALQPWLAADETKQPRDVYYLKVRVTITTDSGIISLSPGTKLRSIGTMPDGIKAKTEDGRQVEVKNSQVTQDADLGAKLADEDSARVAAQQAETAAAIQAVADAKKQAEEQYQHAMSHLLTATPTPAPAMQKLPGSALDNPPPGNFKMATPKPAAKKKK